MQIEDHSNLEGLPPASDDPRYQVLIQRVEAAEAWALAAEARAVAAEARALAAEAENQVLRSVIFLRAIFLQNVPI